MNQNLEKNKVCSEKVRGSNLLSLKQQQSNLIPGSSIIGKLESDATISLDTAIHAYRGLTAKDKTRDVEKYKCKKLNLQFFKAEQTLFRNYKKAAVTY